MSTEYKHKLTVLAPQPHWLGANALAAIFGEGKEADLASFVSPMLSPDIAAVSTGVKDVVVQALEAAQYGEMLLTSPEWDTEGVVDVEFAQAVLDDALIVFVEPSEAFDEEPPYISQIRAWDGNRLLLALGVGLPEIQQILELQSVEQEILNEED